MGIVYAIMCNDCKEYYDSDKSFQWFYYDVLDLWDAEDLVEMIKEFVDSYYNGDKYNMLHFISQLRFINKHLGHDVDVVSEHDVAYERIMRGDFKKVDFEDFTGS